MCRERTFRGECSDESECRTSSARSQQIEDRDEQLGPEDSGGYSTVAEVGVREIKATLMSWIPRHAAVHSGTSTKSLEGDSVVDTSEIA